jgi:two-component system nitrogen regulation response regulator GlnG
MIEPLSALPRSVLVVEDDPLFGELVRDVLGAAGATVSLAATSAAGLAAVARERPDVLCVDIDLPDGTGWEFLDELKRRSLEPETVIIITGGIEAAQSRRRPGTFVLVKPFPIDSLLRLVRGEALPEI